MPDVLAWSDDVNNPVGCEYVVMSHAEGIELRELWFELDSSIQLKCIVNISQKLADMARLEFPAYGCLYMRDSSAMGPETLIPIDDMFGIGPSCSKTYWDCTPGESRYYDQVAPDRGPCKSCLFLQIAVARQSAVHIYFDSFRANPTPLSGSDLIPFTDSLVNAGLSRLPHGRLDRRTRRKYQGTASEHRELLCATRKVLHSMLRDTRIRDNAAPVLVHPDLHMSNIFVDPHDPTKITSSIDWQSACIEPVFMCSLPILDFAVPADYLANTEGPEHDHKVKMIQIWDKALEACLYSVPRIGQLQRTKTEVSRTFDVELFRPFNICHRTWRDGTPLLTSDLMDLAAQWESLGLPGSCPYSAPTGSELDMHKTRWTELAEFQELRGSISTELHANDDGWVPAELWDHSRELHKFFFDELLCIARKPGADMTEDDVRTLWPYDTPY